MYLELDKLGYKITSIQLQNIGSSNCIVLFISTKYSIYILVTSKLQI